MNESFVPIGDACIPLDLSSHYNKTTGVITQPWYSYPVEQYD